MNFEKVEVMPVRCTAAVTNSDGSMVKVKDCLKYLGCSLQSDGHMMGELKQRLGIARDDFKQLSKV